ncbi:MAG: hypothetical protein M3R35_08505 [Candidatus Eremiobacteraeota bacterium]|nr:hypothetical protein [Candidatus Eremiobacteraeota bacterium]
MNFLLIALAATTLAFSPWHGKVLQASPGAIQYRLSVRGTPHTTVKLAAIGLARGWIASFCTDKVCSPMQYSMELPGSGTGAIEFQVIRNDPSAPHRTHVVVRSDAGASAALNVVVKN